MNAEHTLKEFSIFIDVDGFLHDHNTWLLLTNEIVLTQTKDPNLAQEAENQHIDTYKQFRNKYNEILSSADDYDRKKQLISALTEKLSNEIIGIWTAHGFTPSKTNLEIVNESIFHKYITQDAQEFLKTIEVLVNEFGFNAFILTGTFQPFAEYLQSKYKFNGAFGSSVFEYDEQGNLVRFTHSPDTKKNKLDFAFHIVRVHSVDMKKGIVVGDGPTDFLIAQHALAAIFLNRGREATLEVMGKYGTQPLTEITWKDTLFSVIEKLFDLLRDNIPNSGNILKNIKKRHVA